MKNLLTRVLLVVVSAVATLAVVQPMMAALDLELSLAQSQLELARAETKFLRNREDNLVTAIDIKDERLRKLTRDPTNIDDFGFIAGQNETFFYAVLGAGVVVGLILGLVLGLFLNRRKNKKLKDSERKLNIAHENLADLVAAQDAA